MTKPIKTHSTYSFLSVIQSYREWVYLCEFLGEEATAEKYHICFLMCLKFFRLLFPVHYFVKQNMIQWSNVTGASVVAVVQQVVRQPQVITTRPINDGE